METNELTVKPDSVVALSQNGGLDAVIKPLTKEIYLFDTFAAGTSYLNDKSVLTELKHGDTLTIRREDNKYDERACLLLAPNGKKLGYIPQADNIIFSRLLDAGKMLTAKVTNIEQVDDFYTRVNIAIYLVDF